MSAEPVTNPRIGGLSGLALRFFSAFWAYAGAQGLVAVAFVAGAAVLEAAGLTLLAPILTVATGTAPQGAILTWLTNATEWAGAHTHMQKLGLLLVAFVVLMAARALVIYGRDIRLGALQSGFMLTRRRGIAERLAASSWSHVAALSHTRVTNLLTTDLQRLTIATSFMLQGAVAIAVLIIQGVVAFLLSPTMAAVTFLLIALGAVVTLFALRRTRDLGTATSRSYLALMTGMTGFLAGLKSALAQNLQAAFLAEFEQAQSDVNTQQLAFLASQSRSRMIFALVSAVGGAAVVLASFTLMESSAAVILTLIVLFTRMSAPAMLLQQSAHQLVHALPAFDDIARLEAELAAGAEGGVDPPHSPPKGPIALEKVTYFHEDERGVVDLDLKLAPGEILGVVGMSGGGKTTLADLASGLLTPQSGKVTVGGAALVGGVLRGWRDQVAYVSQDNFMFHDSIRRNLLWAAADASEDRLWDALRLVGADELVRQRGLDFRVGERGQLLSGGERQRLALARAVLRHPRLLVLDEATNALDIESEAIILKRLAGLKPRPTIIVVAHRAQSLAYCDRVISVQEGKACEVSAHG